MIDYTGTELCDDCLETFVSERGAVILTLATRAAPCERCDPDPAAGQAMAVYRAW